MLEVLELDHVSGLSTEMLGILELDRISAESLLLWLKRS
jgi:hypothetical protein